MIRIPSRFLTVLPLVVLGASQSALAQCLKYSVEIFAGPPCPILFSSAGAQGISDTGAICGGYVDCAEVGHHVIWWPNGEVTEMPPSADGGIPHAPFSINSSGQVVGQMYVPNLEPSFYRAFLFSNGVTINLGALPGHNYAEARSINENGVICGTSNNSARGPLTAFVWQAGKMLALELPYGTKSEAYDVSDNGHICGWMGHHAQNDTHAFIYQLEFGSVVDVGTPIPQTNNARATGVNNEGTICGFSGVSCGDLCSVPRSFIWSNGVSQDLGMLPGTVSARAEAINDSNVIVGYCSGTTGFVWQNGVMQALNDLVPPDLNLNIHTALDINNAGQIVAHAIRPGPNGTDQVAVRLTPIPPLTGDLNCDWQVNVPDLLGVISAWGPCPPAPPQEPFTKNCHADFNDDGVVNHHDIIAVVLNWSS